MSIMTKKSMLNINQTVWKIIQTDLAIQKDLNRKLINVRALAKYIIKKHTLPTSLDAVISAIRRFEGQEKFIEEEKALLSVFNDSIVSTKNNMACITLSLSSREFFKKICSTNNSPNFKLASGDQEVKIIVESPNLNHFKSIFLAQEIEKIEQDLSEITVRVSEVALMTKGVLARIADELSLANINIHEIIICPPSFFIYIQQKDTVKAHDSILKLSE